MTQFPPPFPSRGYNKWSYTVDRTEKCEVGGKERKAELHDRCHRRRRRHRHRTVDVDGLGLERENYKTTTHTHTDRQNGRQRSVSDRNADYHSKII